MGYFNHPDQISNFMCFDKWKEVINDQINHWPASCKDSGWKGVTPLEVNALYICSMVERLSLTVEGMQEAFGMPQIFIEGFMILLPAIELLGAATDAKVPNTKDKHVETSSSTLFKTGLALINDPQQPPLGPSIQPVNTIVSNHGAPSGERLWALRNYFLHGFKKDTNRLLDINFEHVQGLIAALRATTKAYWNNLCNDTANDRWVERLKQSGIIPFPIPGSSETGKGGFEKCFLRVDIFDQLH